MTISRFLQAVVLVILLHMTVASAEQAAADSGGDCVIGVTTYQYLAPNEVLQVQNALAYFGLYGNRFDGIAGTDTRAGIAAYCIQRGLTVGTNAVSRQALIDELVRDAAIDCIYHGWRGIIASPGFESWMTAQADVDTIPGLLASGTPAQAIDIIDRYLKSQPAAQQPKTTKTQPPTAKTQPLATKTQPEVTKTQPEVTKTQPEVTKPQPEVTKPQPEVTKSQPEVTKSQPEVTKSQPEVTKSQPEVTKSQPEVTKSQPEVTKTQPEVTKSQPEVTKSQPEVTKTQPEVTKTQPEVTKSQPEVTKSQPVVTNTQLVVAETPSAITNTQSSSSSAQNGWPDDWTISYRLDADDFAVFTARQEALDKLAQLKGGGFQESSAFFSSVNAVLKGSPNAATIVALVKKYADQQILVTLGSRGLERLRAARVPEEVLNRLSELESPGYTSRESALQAIPVLLTEDGTVPEAGDKDKWESLIASELDEQTSYRISNIAWTRISQEVGVLPDYVLAVLQKGIAGVDYPLRSLFDIAITNRIGKALDGYISQATDAINTQKLLKLDDAFFENLEKKGFPVSLAGSLAPLKDKLYASSDELSKDVKKELEPKKDDIDVYEKFLISQARKRHVTGSDKAMSWSAAPDCQCLPTGMQHTAYGFYPYWLDGQPQSLDFGHLSRIGYYAASFDDQGAVQTSAGWTADNSKAFALAKKFGTELDIVITKRDWSAWESLTPKKRTAAFTALANNIARLVNIELNDPLSRLEPYISAGTHKSILGDGVTLFFDNYPEDEVSVNEFRGFITALRKQIGGKRFINIMLNKNSLGKGIYSYNNLLLWAQVDLGKADSGTAFDKQMLYLVLLAEPYTDDKKELRINVEKNLSGDARRNTLRMMVPVIVPDGRSSVKDDVIYMGDNFSGIGFWPAPAGEPGKQTIKEINDDYYPISGGKAGPVCRIVCPNRWLFRLAFDLFLFASLGAILIYFFCCECRAAIIRHFILILACTAVPLVVVSMLELGCDPYLEKISTGNMPLLVVLLAIIGYAIWRYWQGQQKIP